MDHHSRPAWWQFSGPADNKKWLVVAYVAALHLVLAAVLLRTDVPRKLAARAGITPALAHPFIVQMREAQRRMDPAIPAGSVLFLGDSNIQSAPVTSVTPNAVNLGIGWQRSDQLLVSMAGYHSMQRAAAVVIMIGTNDERPPLYPEILAAVPAVVPVVLVSAPPMVGADMRANAEGAARACATDPRCTFVDAFAAMRDRPGVLREDGVHLSAAGYALLVPMLREALTRSHTSPSSPPPASPDLRLPSSLR